MVMRLASGHRSRPRLEVVPVLAVVAVGGCCLGNRTPTWWDPGGLSMEAGSTWTFDMEANVEDEHPERLTVVVLDAGGLDVRPNGLHVDIGAPPGSEGSHDVVLQVWDSCGDGTEARIRVGVLAAGAVRPDPPSEGGVDEGEPGPT